VKPIRSAAVSRLRRFEHAYLQRRYAVIFFSLLATLVVNPLSQSLGVEINVVELFLSVNLVAAVIGVVGWQRRRWLRLLLTVAIVARLVAAWSRMPWLEMASLLSWVAIGVIAAAGALRHALRAKAVTAEHVYAALSAYLLAGLFFGVVYWTMERTWAGSFHVAGAPLENFQLWNAIYFSFVTLATVGYGDVVPKSDAVQGLAIVEALVGQFYLAVLVARWVSLYVRGDREKTQS
jgi:hypothetical protein